MLIKVKTLTGKEIEIDIEPNDKVERIKERVEEKVRLERLIQIHFLLVCYKWQTPKPVLKEPNEIKRKLNHALERF